MSIRLMTWAWDLELPIGEKMVLLKLADRANDDGECWPGQEELARQCSMSVRAIRDNLTRLVNRGLVGVEYRNFGMRRGSNVYRINTVQDGVKKAESRPADSAARLDSRPADGDIPTGSRCRSYKEEPSLKAIIRAKEAEMPPLPDDEPPQQNERDEHNDGIGFDALSGMFCNIHEDYWARWEKAYPNLDVDAELLKAESWYAANPKRRKKNHARFITNWLGRASGVATQAKPGRKAA